MSIDQLIKALEEIREKYGGGLEVGYVDNGPFSEGFQLVDSPAVGFDKDGKADTVIL